MTSRLTAHAVAFAVLATATLSYATAVPPAPAVVPATIASRTATAAASVPAVVRLPRVEVVGQRTPRP